MFVCLNKTLQKKSKTKPFKENFIQDEEDAFGRTASKKFQKIEEKISKIRGEV
jgi:hypothetical protein